jgi:hypothetical protein
MEGTAAANPPWQSSHALHAPTGVSYLTRLLGLRNPCAETVRDNNAVAQQKAFQLSVNHSRELLMVEPDGNDEELERAAGFAKSTTLCSTSGRVRYISTKLRE